MLKLDRNYLLTRYGGFEKLHRLEKLNLSDYNINEIDTNSLIELRSLKRLDLSLNPPLKRIKSDALNGLKKLEYLGLNNNSIQEIDADAFSDLLSLRELDLKFNNIKRFKPNVLAGLENLEKLSLGNNELEEIDVNLFGDLANLKILQLNQNRLTRISRKCFVPLKSIVLLELWGNQINTKAASFFNKSLVPSHWKDDLDKNKIEKRLNENGGFESDWNQFLKQFPG